MARDAASPGGRAARSAVLALAALVGSTAADAAVDARQVLAGLQGWLDGTRDLQGRFEQTLVSGALGAGPAEAGRLWIDRPGRMRWDYLVPERKVALVDRDETRLYIEQDRQLWRGRLGDADSLLPRLLAERTDLAAVFTPTLEAEPDGRATGAYRLRLVPRSGTESFEEVVLVLRPPEWAIEVVEVLDAAGNRVRYEFSALRRNRGIPETAFHFEPPPGTEIVASP